VIVVSDTTPLRHLVAIGEDRLLRQIYGSVIVPEVVLRELSAKSAPESVRQWVTYLPAWIKVAPPSSSGLPVIGALGILQRADTLGLLTDLPHTLAALENSGFYPVHQPPLSRAGTAQDSAQPLNFGWPNARGPQARSHAKK
jgi:predicted nucleic acid-binding protein